MTDKMKSNLKSIYHLYRERKVGMIQDKYMLEFLNEYTKVYKFEIPIDPEILIKQVHPYHGHLNKLDKYIEFNAIVNIMKILLVSSFEKLQGQTLLANEIAALGYWRFMDSQGEGFLDLGEFAKLMKIFDFFFTDWNQFYNQFGLFFKLHDKGFVYLSEGNLDNNNIMPFDYFRYIYLERNF